jgi:hypothetical protein
VQSRVPCRVRTRRADLCLKSLDVNYVIDNLLGYRSFFRNASFSRGKTSKLCEYRSFGPFLMVWPLFIDPKNSETSSHQTPPSSGESVTNSIWAKAALPIADRDHRQPVASPRSSSVYRIWPLLSHNPYSGRDRGAGHETPRFHNFTCRRNGWKATRRARAAKGAAGGRLSRQHLAWPKGTVNLSGRVSRIDVAAKVIKKFIANPHCRFRPRSGILGSWKLCVRRQ